MNLGCYRMSGFDAFIKGILDFTNIFQGMYENKKGKGYLNKFWTILGYLIKNPSANAYWAFVSACSWLIAFCFKQNAIHWQTST